MLLGNCPPGVYDPYGHVVLLNVNGNFINFGGKDAPASRSLLSEQEELISCIKSNIF